MQHTDSCSLGECSEKVVAVQCCVLECLLLQLGTFALQAVSMHNCRESNRLSMPAGLAELHSNELSPGSCLGITSLVSAAVVMQCSDQF